MYMRLETRFEKDVSGVGSRVQRRGKETDVRMEDVSRSKARNKMQNKNTHKQMQKGNEAAMNLI